jgi:hypothetical protein
MADIKALKDAIWLKKEEIKREEEPLASWAEQVSDRNHHAQIALIALNSSKWSGI